MKIFFVLLGLFAAISGFAQPTTTPKDTLSSSTIFFDDFNDNKNDWTVDHDRHATTKIEGGIYYLTSTGHAYGAAHGIKIDTRKDFEIETRIKIVSGNAAHKNYYSMVFWGREDMMSNYFTFAKDGFASIETCSSRNQSSCVVQANSLQKTILDPEGFNVYTVRKVGRMYSFLINGTEFYKMPFVPFFGDLIGFGAGRKIGLAIDYLKVSYL